ncbi:hypothetical protein PYCCODRAFT_1429903 [Trametes coccinea BRFM310]|uniref:Secreted protein n=1 Tax=Trametes coccinea (strain BRFM310) TaxID=1353009 RepID=A0A1Y2J458_TRAC3|nr:hypothetical protein PYCCODRAFT_1429903 [Trametes coccinea BRFM310]
MLIFSRICSTLLCASVLHFRIAREHSREYPRWEDLLSEDTGYLEEPLVVCASMNPPCIWFTLPVACYSEVHTQPALTQSHSSTFDPRFDQRLPLHEALPDFDGGASA